LALPQAKGRRKLDFFLLRSPMADIIFAIPNGR
jgi:hypothetical protein